MRRFLLLFLLLCLGGAAFAAAPISIEFTDGSTIMAEPLYPAGDDGIKFKLSGPDAKYTEKYPWARLSQNTLKTLAENPKLNTFVLPFIELSASQRAQKESITIKPVARPERPPAKAGFGDLFGSPIIWVFFGLFYAGNIFAASEIARYRRQSLAVVMGTAAVAPVIGPAIFLAMPTRRQHVEEVIAEEVHTDHVLEEIPLEEVAVEEVQAEPTGPVYPEPTIYQKGQFTFNRRFFETRFNAFTKLAPEDPDLVLDVRSLRGDYVATRISRIEPAALVLQVEKENASADVEIPFIEITQIAIRHKEAPLA